MATIKSYADLQQSKKLAEILPIESADMAYIWHATSDNPAFRFDDDMPPMVLKDIPIEEITADTLPCWSLAALLNLMICPKLEEYVKGVWDLTTFTDETLKTPIEIQDSKDPIDACYKMILELNELNLL